MYTKQFNQNTSYPFALYSLEIIKNEEQNVNTDLQHKLWHHQSFIQYP